MPRSGGAIHPAIRAGSTTRCIRLFTNSRSLPEGSHSSRLTANSSAAMRLPARSHAVPDQTPMVRLNHDDGSARRKSDAAALELPVPTLQPQLTISRVQQTFPRLAERFSHLGT